MGLEQIFPELILLFNASTAFSLLHPKTFQHLAPFFLSKQGLRTKALQNSTTWLILIQGHAFILAEPWLLVFVHWWESGGVGNMYLYCTWIHLTLCSFRPVPGSYYEQKILLVIKEQKKSIRSGTMICIHLRPNELSSGGCEGEGVFEDVLWGWSMDLVAQGGLRAGECIIMQMLLWKIQKEHGDISQTPALDPGPCFFCRQACLESANQPGSMVSWHCAGEALVCKRKPDFCSTTLVPGDAVSVLPLD